jgi:methyl-accepting chemotaxis protein
MEVVERTAADVGEITRAAHEIAASSRTVLAVAGVDGDVEAHGLLALSQANAAAAEDAAAAVQEINASMEEMSASADELARIARGLQDETDRFRTGAAAAEPDASPAPPPLAVFAAAA